MLVQFSFGNFRSFKDTATLSMVAAEGIKVSNELNKANVFSARPELDLLRVAALYGPNASGKSNIARALLHFVRCVVQSANIGFEFYLVPFLLDTTSKSEPVFCEIIFLKENVQYRYGFSVRFSNQEKTPDEIQEEWLFQAHGEWESVLFEREKDIVKLGEVFSEGAGLLKDGRLKRKDALFLSLAAQNGEDVSSKLVEYIVEKVHFISGINDKNLREFTEECLKENRYKDEMSAFLRDLDTGILSVARLEDQDVDPFVEYISARESEEPERSTRDDIARNFQIVALHPKFDTEGRQAGFTSFPFELTESEGSKKLLAFAGPIFHTLEHGDILFVDEMDARFHPLVTQAIVGLFQSSESNPKNAQLIFVTHDTNLLYQHKLRRDQIWFVQKDRLGASHLYSLADIADVDEEGAFGHDYSQGYYGAIPYLNGFARTLKNDANS